MIKYITDLHLKNLPNVDAAVMDHVCYICQKNDTLVIGGDVFDTFGIGLSNDVFYEKIVELSKICKDIYILTGNHDESQGVCSFRLFNYARDNVHIVEKYHKVVIEGVNYHFLNHFRHYPTFNQLELDGVNVLFSHAEINNADEIPKKFKLFDKVFNGHIHDFSTFDNVVNTGAFRQTKKNESEVRYYLEIDGTSYVKKEFVTPVTVKEINFKDLETLKDTPSIVKVLTKSKTERERFKDIKDKFKNVYFKVESYSNSDVIINNSKKEIKKDLDIKAIFKDYYKEFCAKFDYKTPYRKEIFNLFNEVSGTVKDNTATDFKILSLSASNFKLFENLEIDFENNIRHKGLTLVKGVNNDETVIEGISSNESGKTVIRQAIEYALIGSEAKISPLRTGEKSGEVDLSFILNGDLVRFLRKYNSKTNELRININKVEFGKDMTMTEKTEAFFNTYNLKNSIDFILLYARDWVSKFFNPKSNQKAKILAEMFPSMLALPGEVATEVQNKVKELEKSYNSELQALELLQMERKLKAKSFHESKVSLENWIAKLKKDNSDYIEKLKGLETPEKPLYTLDYLNSIAKYENVESPESPYGHFTYIDVEAASDKVLAHKKHLKRLEVIKEVGEYKSYIDSYLKGELKKDTAEIKKQIAILNHKVIEERDRYTRELNKLTDTGKCPTCGSLPAPDVLENIKNEIKSDLKKIADYGLSLAADMKTKEDKLVEIESYNKNYEKITQALSCFTKTDLMLIDEETKEDIAYDQHVWEKDNGLQFNFNLKRFEEKLELNIPDGIDIKVEMEKIAKYNSYDNTVNQLQSVIDQQTKGIKEYTVKLEELGIEIRDYNKKSREIRSKNKYKIIEEELNVCKALAEVLSAKKTLTFENYYVSLFLGKMQDIINSFLSTLFTRDVSLTVSDCDLIFTDENMERTYNDFSKGAKTKIDIALVLALSLIQFEYGFSTNFMYIDEFLDDGVDEVNIQRVVELLRNCFSGIDYTFLVSHKNINDIVDHTIYVTRTNNKSICSY